MNQTNRNKNKALYNLTITFYIHLKLAIKPNFINFCYL